MGIHLFNICTRKHSCDLRNKIYDTITEKVYDLSSVAEIAEIVTQEKVLGKKSANINQKEFRRGIKKQKLTLYKKYKPQPKETCASLWLFSILLFGGGEAQSSSSRRTY